MSDTTPPHLPVINESDDDGAPSCSPKIYVSNEEKVILDAMRTLRDRAIELRSALETTDSVDERDRCETELARLRAERANLATRREQAFKRKMIMLGHLPPDNEVSLF